MERLIYHPSGRRRTLTFRGITLIHFIVLHSHCAISSFFVFYALHCKNEKLESLFSLNSIFFPEPSHLYLRMQWQKIANEAVHVRYPRPPYDSATSNNIHT